MQQKIKVDIIVINWNSGELTLQAVRPYLEGANDFVSCNVLIVDNASTDDSKTLFAGHHIPNIVFNTENLGFGRACNQALATSKADYVLLLNPDTISSVQTLEKLVSFLENNQSYAIVGPQQISENDEVIRTCARFPDFSTHFNEMTGLSKISPKIFHPQIMLDWNHLSSMDVDQVMGSYMLMRRSILDKVGLMDTDYFVYREDLDISKRIHDAGYKSRFLAEEKIIHYCGKSGESVKGKRLLYSLNSRRIYWKKHLRKHVYYALTVTSICIEPITRVIDILLKGKPGDIKEIIGAYKLYYKSVFKGE